MIKSSARGVFGNVATVFVAVIACWSLSGFARDDNPPQQADCCRIAVVQVGQIIEKMRETSRFKEPRDAEYKATDEKYQVAFDQIESKRKALESIPRSSPEYADAYAKYVKDAGEINSLRDQLKQRFTTWSLTQSREIYDIVTDAACRIAEKRGFRYLLSSGTRDSKALTVQDYVGQSIQMSARPVLMRPDEADITEDVIADLNL